MNDGTRGKMEDEICRSLDRLKTLSPESEEYQKISSKVVQMTELVNKDDEARNRFTIDTDRLDAEAKAEAERQGNESEKLRLETEKVKAQLELENTKLELENAKLTQEKDRSKKEAIRAYILAGFSGLVTVGTFVGTWIFNARAQARSEYFEETGHAYTSRFSRFQMKEPNHPNLKM